jgi:hypothetical protein
MNTGYYCSKMELRAFLKALSAWSRDEELCNQKYFGRRLLGVIVISISLSSVEIRVNQLMAFLKRQRSGCFDIKGKGRRRVNIRYILGRFIILCMLKLDVSIARVAFASAKESSS